jgi:hypothetical protein
MIHKNKQDALAALKEYCYTVSALAKRLGVHEECEESCCEVYASVQFYADDGKTVCRYSE